jgi:hypothetical protein
MKGKAMKKALIVLVLVLFTAIAILAQTHLSGLSHVKTIRTASSVQLSIPSGFRQIDIGSGEGVRVFRKDYAGNRKDFVTIIDLRHATIRSLTGDVINSPQGQVYRKALTEFWSDAVKLETSDQKAKIVVNGTFFADKENGREINPTGISFGLKTKGKVISYGYGLNEYPGQIKIFAFNIPAHRSNALTAWIQPHNEGLFNRSFPDLVGALDPDVDKQKVKSISRTFLGIRDNDSDGNYETVFIFSSNAATQNSAANILSSFGAVEIVMLDGGGSSGLVIDGTPQINTTRTLPHTLAVYVKPTSRPDNVPPSSHPNFQSYRATNGAFEIQFPSDWKASTGQDGSVILAPEGAYGVVQGRFSFTHGAMVGFVPSCGKDAMLMGCFEELLSKLWQSNTYLRWNEQSTYSGRLAGQESFATYMSGQTPAGYKERVSVIACKYINKLAYILFIAPDQEFQRYEPVFRRMQESFKLLPINPRGPNSMSPDEAWNAFWSQFQDAVNRRDRVALRAMMSPKFDYSFGDANGTPTKAFRYWNNPRVNGWTALSDVIARGAVRYNPPPQWEMKGQVRIAPPVAGRDGNYVGWRAIFELGKDGRWQFVAFLVGD